MDNWKLYRRILCDLGYHQVEIEQLPFRGFPIKFEMVNGYKVRSAGYIYKFEIEDDTDAIRLSKEQTTFVKKISMIVDPEDNPKFNFTIYSYISDGFIRSPDILELGIHEEVFRQRYKKHIREHQIDQIIKIIN